MSKFIGVIVGGLEVVLGVVALFVPGLQGVGYLLISAGVGTLLTGVGTILSSNAAQQLLGYAAAARNPRVCVPSWSHLRKSCVVVDW